MSSGSHSSGVRDSSRVTPLPYLTKFVISAMSQSPQLYLTRSGDELVGFQSSNSVSDVLEAMWGVVWSNALMNVPDM